MRQLCVFPFARPTKGKTAIFRPSLVVLLHSRERRWFIDEVARGSISVKSSQGGDYNVEGMSRLAAFSKSASNAITEILKRRNTVPNSIITLTTGLRNERSSVGTMKGVDPQKLILM